MINLQALIHCSESKQSEAQEHRHLFAFGFPSEHSAILLKGTKSQNGFKTVLSLNIFNTSDKTWRMTSEEKKKKIKHRTKIPNRWIPCGRAKAQLFEKDSANPHVHQAQSTDQTA